MGNTQTDRQNRAHTLYLAFIGLIFAALVVVFLFFPRSRYSELEKRELNSFPSRELLGENPGAFTAAVSQWFSDSEPYRDLFMTMSMAIREGMKLRLGNPQDAVSVKSTGTGANLDLAKGVDDLEELQDNSGNPLADASAKLATPAVIVAGAGSEVRGLMVFGGSSRAGGGMIETSNLYAETFPDINVYTLVAPLATEFYLPQKAASASRPQLPTLENIRNHLNPAVKYVDVHSILKHHSLEDIYLRTDHHWSALGAYYGAKAFAKVAGVPFKDLKSYDKNVIHGFVGSMYGYTKDISFKKAPEDFVYYVPKKDDYTTTYITYQVNKDYRVTSQSKPYKSSFFKKFRDGSGLAYNVFMGGDQHLVKIETDVPGSRKLLLIKDSYGNALPGYLFYSFPEIHVIDFRYFPGNLKQYIRENDITDILLAFNIFNACNSKSMNRIKGMLKQSEGFASSSAKSENKEKTNPRKLQDKADSTEPAPESEERQTAVPSESVVTTSYSESEQ